jgi:hypothetical protein
MGPPVSRSYGRATWHCPFHNDEHPSFCTLPPKAGCKDRFRCFGCGAWGDEYDLLRLFFDRENFDQRRLRLDRWREDWKREQQPGAAAISHRGPGSNEQTTAPLDDRLDRARCEFLRDLEHWELRDDFARSLLSQFEERCRQNDLSMEAVLRYWKNWESLLQSQLEIDRWLASAEMQHYLGCLDSECKEPICRAEMTPRRAIHPNGKAK